MIRITTVAFLAVLMLACNSSNSIAPEAYMDRARQDVVMEKLIRYATKIAPAATRKTMFNPEFEEYYQKAVKEYEFMYLSREAGVENGYWFLIARQARSIKPAYEGIGGRLELNGADSLITYEEIFRTWKMDYTDLQTRGKYLFQSMMKGEDLSPFYTKMAGDKYIEFPDDRFTFDVNERRWKDAELDTLSIN